MAADVIAIFGPTGVGKTAVAIALAQQLRAAGEDPVAVSADALQVYRGLETLTGVASAAEQRLLEHRLVSFLAPAETFSAGRYAELAHAEIDSLLAEGKRPIVVGGTGLYLRAALAELSLAPPPSPGLREALNARLATEGSAALHAELARRDPDLAGRIAPGDGRRIVRALERLGTSAGSRPPAREPGAGAEAVNQLWTGETRHPTALFGLVMERGALDARIDARVERIVAAGAEREVRAVAAGPVSATARKALGFEQLLAGDVEAMKLRTRQFARRQLTWMRKLPDLTLLDVTGRPATDTAAAIVRATSAAGR